ncbi:MAG: purine-binding chemotaxis protein CheW [Gammaproteobacteria bacterium]|nr:purine-binding chemotaxis protein CheW [Gammaproteobacteria bacterium]
MTTNQSSLDLIGSGLGADSSQFLTFILGDEYYGIDILKVREIRGWERVREMHDTPAFVKGVLNIRGTMVSVIDLRIRFRLDTAEYSPTTVVIVLNVNHGETESDMGVVVDSVSDVLTVASADVKAAPELGSKINTEYIQGIVNHEDRMIMLLESDKLLDPEEFELIV